jgi:GTP-binding protein YchF
MSLSIGIVGLANVGKSTLFNALLKSELAESANYAFTTIEPNIGIVSVPDDRLEKLAKIENSAKIVPATIKFVDIAGLIKGAAKGEGLGNKFLSHIREVDTICLVTRVFENEKITHVAGRIDPKSDIETIFTELALADLETVAKKKLSLKKDSKSGNKIAIKELEVLEKVEKVLENSQPAITTELDKDEKKLIASSHLLTMKPFIYVFNVKEDDASTKPEEIIKKYNLVNIVQPENAIVISVKIEFELSQLGENDQKEFLLDISLEESGLNRLSRIAYKTLNLISYFTAGEKEARAWTVRDGAKAPEAAGKIHSDFEQKFIKAQVIDYETFVKLNGWKKAKELGKIQLEGKDYIVKDGDVIIFLI